MTNTKPAAPTANISNPPNILQFQVHITLPFFIFRRGVPDIDFTGIGRIIYFRLAFKRCHSSLFQKMRPVSMSDMYIGVFFFRISPPYFLYRHLSRSIGIITAHV